MVRSQSTEWAGTGLLGSPLAAVMRGGREKDNDGQWDTRAVGLQAWEGGCRFLPDTSSSHARSSVRSAWGTHGGQPSPLPLLLPRCASPALLLVEWLARALAQHTAGSMGKGPGAPLQQGREGHSETGERFKSAVALACQGRLENSILSPPHRCIQFLSIFITPSCTGPASRVGGRSQGGLGIDFWNKLEVQVTHISLKIYVCLCVFLPI